MEKMNDKLSYLIRKLEEMEKKIDKKYELDALAYQQIDSILYIMKSKLTEPDEILKIDEVIKMFKLSRNWVHKATKKKSIPHIRVEGTILYLRSKLYAMFDTDKEEDESCGG